MPVARLLTATILSVGILGLEVHGDAVASDYLGCSDEDVKVTVAEMIDDWRTSVIEDHREIAALATLQEPTDEFIVDTLTSFGLDNSTVLNYTPGTFELKFITILGHEETGAPVCEAQVFAEQRVQKTTRHWRNIKYAIRLDIENDAYFVQFVN